MSLATRGQPLPFPPVRHQSVQQPGPLQENRELATAIQTTQLWVREKWCEPSGGAGEGLLLAQEKAGAIGHPLWHWETLPLGPRRIKKRRMTNSNQWKCEETCWEANGHHVHTTFQGLVLPSKPG